MRGKKTLTTAATMVAALSVSMPLAQATTYNLILGDRSGEKLVGTSGADLIGGRGGDDKIRPGRGTDIVRGGPGDDWVYLLNDGVVDRIHCGEGFDVVAYRYSVDQHDIIDPNCEAAIA